MVQLSAKVSQTLKEEGISLTELEVMLHHAAICSHERGNRRFHHWLFEVRAGVVKRMSAFEMTEIGKDTGSGMIEDCEQCDGEGCHSCGWIGEVRRFI